MRIFRKRLEACGFTLIELLIGFSIFAVIGVCVYSTFASGLKLNRRAQSLEGIYRDARMSMEILARDLENMAAYHFPVEDGTASQIAFEGDETSVSFFVPMKDGLKRVKYLLQSMDEGHIYKEIVLHRQRVQIPFGGRDIDPNSVDAPQDNQALKTVALIRQIGSFGQILTDERGRQDEVLSLYILNDSLKFLFLDASQEKEEPSWENQWTQPYLPNAVRVELTFYNPKDNSSLPVSRDVLIPIGGLTKQEY